MPAIVRNSKVQQLRDEAVLAARQTIEDLEVINLPKFVIKVIATLVVVWLAAIIFFKVSVWVVARMLGAAFAILIAPFIGLYVFVDLLLITVWFGRGVSNKLSGEKNNENDR